MTAIQLTLTLNCISFRVITQYTSRLRCEWLVGKLYGVAKMPFLFSHVEYCDMHFVYGFCDAVHVLLLKNTKGVFPIEGFHLEVY